LGHGYPAGANRFQRRRFEKRPGKLAHTACNELSQFVRNFKADSHNATYIVTAVGELRFADQPEADHAVALEAWPRGGSCVGAQIERFFEERAATKDLVGPALRPFGILRGRSGV